VTQVPIQADFGTIGSTFGNHKADMVSVGRGGDLWIRYPDGTLKNLTHAAGLGLEGAQAGENAIAVRDPSVHWDGQRALVSMVKGAPTRQHEVKTYYWQIYEVTGLRANDTPVFTRLAQQPANFNNLTPIYGSDDRVIFSSDRPRSGQAHHYPQLDEYESAVTNTGLWSIDPATPGGTLWLLNHAPSGNFTPIIDSWGRIVFTQWDHLMRDQQAGVPSFGTFNYASEAADAARLATSTEVFPETRDADEAARQGINRHVFNQFLPWTMLEDGSGGETLNHLGRHELRKFFERSFLNDNNLVGFSGNYDKPVYNFFQIKEDPLVPGRYVGIDAPEFQTHASGQVVSITAPLGQRTDLAQVNYITHAETKFPADTASPNHSGHYRDPLPLSDGKLIAAHTAETRAENPRAPRSLYDFRLKTLRQLPNGLWVADTAVTPGINKSVEYWSPGVKITYSGALWELQPVEVKPRNRPTRLSTPIEAPERSILDQAGVDIGRLHEYLVRNGLALAITRDVTSRDTNDRQQPFNLRVPGGTSTVAGPGKVYDVAHLQFYQGDQIRGLGGTTAPRAGRRVLAQAMHDSAATNANPPNPSGPAGSVKVAADGSAAAFVPAQRALSWQVTDTEGTAVVRERYWVTFQPGEVRVCASCHGLNDKNQAGFGTPMNPPQALLDLLRHWKRNNP
jgi:Hydrazine synthase alpha subunit middle domain